MYNFNQKVVKSINKLVKRNKKQKRYRRGCSRSMFPNFLGRFSSKKLTLDDLYGCWYWVLAGRARRELPREVSNVSVGGMRAEL